MPRALRPLANVLEKMKSSFLYDPVTGILSWNIKTSNVRPGVRAGTISRGRHDSRQVKFCGRFYREHHIAWFMAYGVWPKDEIDHKNRNALDNRLANLREATRSQQMGNACRANKSGLRGVGFHPATGKWRAKIHGKNRYVHIGLFVTKEEAARAYDIIATKHFGEFYSPQVLA